MPKASKERKTKTIIRKRKDRENPWVTINKSVFEHEEISLEAKGLMGIFLSKPDNWKIVMENIIKLSKNGRDVHYRVLKELRQFGYLVLVEFRIKGTIIQKEYIIYEQPIFNPYWEKPLIVLVNSIEEIEEWSDDNIETLISQTSKPDPEIQDMDDQPDPENPDEGKPDEGKPDEGLSTLLTNNITNNFFNLISNVLLTSNDTVVVSQRIIDKLFSKKLPSKQIAKLIELAKDANKDFLACVENAYDYHTKVEKRDNPYGAIKHAIECNWVINDSNVCNQSEDPFVHYLNIKKREIMSLPKTVRKQTILKKAMEYGVSKEIAEMLCYQATV